MMCVCVSLANSWFETHMFGTQKNMENMKSYEVLIGICLSDELSGFASNAALRNYQLDVAAFELMQDSHVGLSVAGGGENLLGVQCK